MLNVVDYNDFVYEDSNDKKQSNGIYMEKRLYHSPRISVYESSKFGRCMYLDGKLQVTQFDWDNYHKTMVLAARKNTYLEDKYEVLIIGGGDGGALVEALRMFPNRDILMVEISQEVIDVSSALFNNQEYKKALADPRVRIVIGDGFDFIRNTNRVFGSIIVDCSDPENEASKLYSSEFFAACRKQLHTGGSFVMQCPNAYLDVIFASKMFAMVKAHFGEAFYVQAYMPSFVSGGIGFIVSGEEDDGFRTSSWVDRKVEKQIEANSYYSLYGIPLCPPEIELVIPSMYRSGFMSEGLKEAYPDIRQRVSELKYFGKSEHPSLTVKFSVSGEDIMITEVGVFHSGVPEDVLKYYPNRIFDAFGESIARTLPDGSIRFEAAPVFTRRFAPYQVFDDYGYMEKLSIRVSKSGENLPSFNNAYKKIHELTSMNYMRPVYVSYKNINEYEVTFAYKNLDW